MNLKTHISTTKYIPKISIILVIIATIALVYLTNQDTLRIETISIERLHRNGSVLVNENRIFINFSRPLQNEQDTSNIVSFEPEISDYSTKIVNDRLVISFKNGLNKNTDYKLNLNKNLKDIYGQSLSEDYEYTFVTQPVEILYMKDNAIYLHNLSTKNSEIIYNSEQIEDFSVTDDGRYLYVLEQESLTENNLLRYDIKTEKHYYLKLSDEYNIRDFELDSNNNLWLIMSDREISETSMVVFTEKLKIEENKLNGKYEILESLDAVVANAYDFKIRNNGDLIVQTFSETVLTNIDAEFIKTYDSHETIGHYDYTNDDYYNYLNYYLPEGSNSELYKIDYNKRVKIAEFDNAIQNITTYNENKLVINLENRTEQDFNFYYDMIIYNLQDKKIEKEFKNEAKSHENPKSDKNNKLLAYEEIDLETILKDFNPRDVGKSGRPKDARLIILIDDEEIEIENAYEPLWVN